LYGTVLPQAGSQAGCLHIQEDLVQHAPNSFLGLISKALRANYDVITKEPLPERWVDLIRHLNERERMEAERDQPQEPRKRRPH
jgi:hypothetical protein